MPTIAFRFPAGKYHSTPWGSHVNEGVVEWPPSPWRLIRALIATGFSKLGWVEIPELGRRLFEKFSAVLPDYHLPHGQPAHSRHYMPIYSGKNETTTKVLDTFIRFSSEAALIVDWKVELDADERSLLDQLTKSMSYLGRAESWVSAEVCDSPETDGCFVCIPMENLRMQEGSAGWEQVPLLSPTSSQQFEKRREVAVEASLGEEERQRDKKLTKKQKEKIESTWPENLLACLTAETAFLQKHGWSQPPGSRRILYARPKEALEPKPRAPRSMPSPPVEAALLALYSDTESGKLLPLMTRSLPQTEIIHESLVSILTKKMKVTDCPALFGKDGKGRKLDTGHRHAHFIPLDLDEDGRLDHLLIHSQMLLDQTAQRAITRLNRTWTKGSRFDIFVNCVGLGSLELFRRELKFSSGCPIPLLASSKTWESITPFVPCRYLKKKYTIEDHVRSELEHRNLPLPESIEVFNYQGDRGRKKLVRRNLLNYVRQRRKGKPQPPMKNAFGLRIVFTEPVQGPLALGYGAHYGLGLFTPDAPGESH